MKRAMLFAALVAATTPAFAQVLQDDLVFGLSRTLPTDTIELHQAGGGGPAAYVVTPNPWITQGFIQAIEFDNLGGTTHNASGNMLGMNFGTTVAGVITVPGQIFTMATDGTGGTTLIGETDGLTAGTVRTQIGGLSVSPKNTKVALSGYDSAEIHILDYTPGTGDGLTGALGGERMTSTTGTIVTRFDTQGTAWLNERTVLAFNGDGNITAVDSTDMSTSVVATVPITPGTIGNTFTDIEFQPLISPYVYAMNGTNVGGVTVNTLSVLDPRLGFMLVNQFDFSAPDPLDPFLGPFMNTTREIAFDSEGNLYVSQFIPSAQDNLGGGIDYILGANNPANIVSNVSVNFPRFAGRRAAFNGLDVANSKMGLDGDANLDGMVTGADFTIWADNFGDVPGLATLNMGDFNCDGSVTGADFTIWADNFGMTGGDSPNAVPEPSSIVLGVLAAVGMLLVARRRS